MLSLELQADLHWEKAEASVPGGMCVEVASYSDGVAVRHSVTPEDGALVYARDEFAVFLNAVKRGEFDHLV